MAWQYVHALLCGRTLNRHEFKWNVQTLAGIRSIPGNTFRRAVRRYFAPFICKRTIFDISKMSLDVVLENTKNKIDAVCVRWNLFGCYRFVSYYFDAYKCALFTRKCSDENYRGETWTFVTSKMDVPGLSLFQGAESLQLNTSTQQRIEEQDAFEDQQRRNEEVTNRFLFFFCFGFCFSSVQSNRHIV